MNKTLKIITIIGVLCMLVPFMVLGSFASAETVTTEDSEFIFHEFHPGFTDGSGFNWIFDADYSYFDDGLSIPYSSNYFLSDLPVRNVDWTLSLNGSPSVLFRGDYAFARFSYPSAIDNLVISMDSYDARLHSYALVCLVPKNSWSPDELLYFDGVPLVDICLQHSLTVSYIPDDGLYITGSQVSSSNPSFDFFLFYNRTDPLFEFFVASFDVYMLTWYGAPTFHTLSSSSTDLYFISFVDMVENSLGYQAGYDAGVTAGKQQGYDDGLAEGFDEGYDSGVTAGKQQANNTVTQNSASYLQGYQDGLNAPEYSFMSLIASVFDAPIRALFGYTQDGVQHPGLFSIDILGMNMGAFIASIFSLAVILTVLRLVLGGKS